MDDQTKTSTPEDAISQEKAKQELALQLIEIEKAIKTYVAGIQSKQEEAKGHAEALRDLVEQDASYQSFMQQMKDMQQQERKLKAQLMATTAAMTAKGAVKDIKAEVKDMQTMLSKRLLEFKELSGLSEIELGDGILHSIIQNAKLVKKKGN